MIRIENASKSFDGGRSYAVQDLSLEIRKAETLVLLGTSGCGKTTTLKMINRLLEPSAGSIKVDGHDVGTLDPVALRRSMGYVFQGIGLLPHLTIEQNAAMPLRLAGWTKSQQKERVEELLQLVGLPIGDFGGRLPDELSGGQQQRVAVARALAADPTYLLMDEPFGALDAVTRDAMQQELLSLKSRLRKTIVFVTHDIVEALILADRIAVLSEGRLQQVGTGREILKGPANTFVDDLFGKALGKLDSIRDLS